MDHLKAYKYCQSCGIPLKQYPEKGGTNVDGSKNKMYCSFCYKDGEFTFKGTVEEMQAFCRNKMMELGSFKLLAWLFTRSIPRLKRWKN